MSKVNRLAQISIAFLLGGLCGYYFSEAGQASLPPQESNDIFRALVLASGLPIPKQHLHCEVAGASKSTSEGIEYPDTKLSDYITSYLSWSQKRTINSSDSLSCEDSKMKKCTWVFGESKSSEGWGRFLKFEYNPTTKSVVPSSLECLDVP